jgi:hypothetical protein
MNKFTKLIACAVCALALITSAFAADTNNASLFNAGEVGLSLGTGYVVDPDAAFQSEYTFNLNAGAFWFPFRYLGAEVNVPFYQTTGVSVDEVQAGLLFRLPLAKEVVFFKNFAPYVGAGAVYNWQAEDDKVLEEWAYVGKVGLELRLNKHWGFAVEGQYRNNEFNKDQWDDGSLSVAGILKLVF